MTGSPSDRPGGSPEEAPEVPEVAAEEPAEAAVTTDADVAPVDEAAEDGPATPDAGPGDSEAQASEPDDAEPDDDPVPDALAGFAAEMAGHVGGSSWSAEHGTVKVRVERDRWHGAVATASERLPFFGWLSAVDWARDVQVGEPAVAPDQLEERFEVLCRLSSVVDASAVIVATDVPKDDPWMPTIIDVFPGAGWHEREAAEMFGLDFRGNPNKNHLYLPDSFEGHPLRKDFPLLSREVKPWPGTVDVEGMPGTENVEAGDGEVDEAAAEDEA